MLKELRKLIAEKLLDFSKIIMPDGEEKIILFEAISFYIKKVVSKNYTQQPLCGSEPNGPTPKPLSAASHSGKRCATFDHKRKI